MTKLEKLRADLVKAETTFNNARKRKAMLQERIRTEEQRELQSAINASGLSLAEVKAVLGMQIAVSMVENLPNNTAGGEDE